MAKGLGLAEGEFEKMLEGVKFAADEENLRFFGIGTSQAVLAEEIFDKAGKTWLREGLIDGTDAVLG